MRSKISPIIYKLIDSFNWLSFKRDCYNIFNGECQRKTIQFPHVLPIVHEYVSKQLEAGGLGGDFTAFKLIELSQTLANLKPKSIIEFGGGATTCVFALYAQENPGVEFISLDESSYFQNLTKEHLGSKLSKYVNFIQSDRQEYEFRGKRVCSYSHDKFPPLKERSWFCYVDGPSASSKDKSYKTKLPCVDVLKLLSEGVGISDILFDCRFDTVRFFLDSVEFEKFYPKLHYRAARGKSEKYFVNQNLYHSMLLTKNLSL